MRKMFVASLLLLIAFSSYASDPAQDAKAAEAAFAKAFADRDADRFFSYVADDATFFGAKRELVGKTAVREAWTKYFADKQAPFSWKPERFAANGAGNLALTHGSVYDPQGTLIGYFTSVWQKQADGSWKVLFDGPGSNPPCPPPPAPPTPPAPPAAPTPGK